MAVTDKDIEIIEQYVAGLLHGDKLQEFERRLEQDKAIIKQVEFMKALRQGAKVSVLQDKMKMIQQWDAGMEELIVKEKDDASRDKEIKQESAQIKKMPWLKYAAVAAILIAVFYAGNLWMEAAELDRLEQKYAGIELPASHIVRTRSGTSTADISPLKLKAFNVYDLALIELEQGNYKEGDRYLRESLRLFEEVLETQGDTIAKHYINSIRKIL